MRDEATFATANCSRRAGKTRGVGGWLIEGPHRKPEAPSAYVTITRKLAKRNIWPTLLNINRKYRLGFIPNESDLTLKKNGEDKVFLFGMETKGEIEKLRGTGWGRVAIDEAQALPPYLRELVEEVLMPSLIDHDGKVRMIGTPAPVPTGYFYDACFGDQSKIDLEGARWSRHSWTVWDNPYLPGAKAMLAKVLALRGLTVESPAIQREWFGRWVLDPDSLVFHFDRVKNAFDALPKAQGRWQYVIGIDIGFGDADAVAVLAYNEHLPSTWLIEEHLKNKGDITSLVNVVKEVYYRLGPDNVRGVVMDPAGMGMKLIVELQARHEIPCQGAKKSEKEAHIELLNDAMRTGRFYAHSDSRFAHDVMLVEWDKDKSTPDKRVVSERFHSDITDAVLYAYMLSLSWLSEPRIEVPAPGTMEALEAQQDDYWSQLEEEHRRRSEEEATWQTNDWET